jgi:hypothetical protein
MDAHRATRQCGELAAAIERQLAIADEVWGGHHDASVSSAHRDGEALRDRMIAVLAGKNMKPAGDACSRGSDDPA